MFAKHKQQLHFFKLLSAAGDKRTEMFDKVDITKDLNQFLDLYDFAKKEKVNSSSTDKQSRLEENFYTLINDYFSYLGREAVKNKKLRKKLLDCRTNSLQYNRNKASKKEQQYIHEQLQNALYISDPVYQVTWHKFLGYTAVPLALLIVAGAIYFAGPAAWSLISAFNVKATAVAAVNAFLSPVQFLSSLSVSSITAAATTILKYSALGATIASLSALNIGAVMLQANFFKQQRKSRPKIDSINIDYWANTRNRFSRSIDKKSLGRHGKFVSTNKAVDAKDSLAVRQVRSNNGRDRRPGA